MLTFVNHYSEWYTKATMGINSQQRNGFTIVELLVVIVVIAILAAISIVVYSGIQSRTRASAIAQELKQLDKSFTLWATGEGITRWPSDTLAGGGTNISTLIASTTPPFDTLKEYLQKNPSVSGIGTAAWYYDQDDYLPASNDPVEGYEFCVANPSFNHCNGDNKTDCSANEGQKLTGVNIVIQWLTQSDEKTVRTLNDIIDSGETDENWINCGKVRWYHNGSGNYAIIYALSYTKVIAQ